MFTDIVGYTILMGKDEDLAFKILRKNRQIQKELIEKYRGEWLKEMGDGILASFSTCSDAVRCAGEIQHAAKKESISLRIGIHEGEVVFEGSDVFGDGVNVASRLEEVAAEGSINVSGSVYKDIKNKSGITTEFLEEKVLKNVEDPVKIYNVTYKANQDYITPEKTSQKKEGVSIAVLPFMNMSNDPEQEYFCDGMTEEIINALTHVESLKVIARTSAFAFKGQQIDIRSIGRKLDVGMLLEGSVRRAGNKLRITAQLIQVSDGTHIWSERYDRELEDVFEIQDEISLAIVNKLKVQLFEGEKRKILKSQTENLEAYKFYLKGRYEWNKRTKEGVENSIIFLKSSIKLDPDYALAYTGLADCYYILSDWGYMLPNETFPKAKEYVKKSLDIDDTLGETYVSKATVLGWYDWDWATAEKNYNMALKLNPNYPTAYQWYAITLCALGRFEESIVYINKALDLDPLSLVNNLAKGIILYNSRNFDEALKQFNKVNMFNNKVPGVYFFNLLIHYIQKNFNKSVQEHLTWMSLNPLTQEYISEVEDTYKKSGEKGFLQWLIDNGLTLHDEIYNQPYYKIAYYLMMEEKQKALKCMEQCVQMRSVRLGFSIKVDPIYDPLRQDPHFREILKQMNLD
jgi:TolB-like protein